MVKSLRELLEEAGAIAANFPPPVDACNAAWCLNDESKPAHANEHIASIGFCTSTVFVQCQGEVICVACWTPKR